MTRRVLIVIALAFAVLGVREAAAQEMTIRGQVLGPDDAPLADHRVVLHRVDASGGATIAETQSDASGRFELRAAPTPDTSAVYFVASRYMEELYIGPMFRQDDPMAAEQTLQVGVAATSASAMMGGDETLPPRQVGRPATSRNWLLLIVPLVGLVAVAIYALVPRNRIAPQRTLLIRVAELDERLETAPPAQRESLLEERRQLMAQLRAG